MKIIKDILDILIVIGALNWGLIGLFDYNLINKLLKKYPMTERLIYILVGVAGIYAVIQAF